MTDAEMSACRAAVEGDAPYYDVVTAGRDLMGEVYRLRAELAGRRQEELWLADARKICHSGLGWHRLIGRLLSHIDWQQDQIRILLTDELGLVIAREQGAAEELARLVFDLETWRDYYLGLIEGVDGEETRKLLPSYHKAASLSEAIADIQTTVAAPPDLLPPLEARRLLAEAERKVAVLREAMGRIGDCELGRNSCYGVAKVALGATRPTG